MPEYETICVLEPDVQGERLARFEDKIKKIFTTHNIEQVTRQDWGLRKLAYPIRKFKTGHYLRFVYDGQGPLVNEFERNLGYEEAVLRFLTIKLARHAKPDLAPEQVAHFGPDPFEHRFGRDRGDWGDRGGFRGGRRDRYERQDGRPGDKKGEGTGGSSRDGGSAPAREGTPSGQVPGGSSGSDSHH